MFGQQSATLLHHWGVRNLPIPIIKGMPAATAKEAASLAHVKLLCAQASLNTSELWWDNGIDLQLQCTKFRPGQPDLSDILIGVQLKSTSSWIISDGRIAFSITRATYDRLRSVNRIHDRYLFLHLLPPTRFRWMRHSANSHSTVLLHATYYLDLKGFPDPPQPEQATITVHVPVRNVLTASKLRELFRLEASKWI